MNLKTRIRSIAIRTFASQGYLELLRAKARAKRKLTGAGAKVLYFHQVDDPYSHLAIQKLGQLRANYAIAFEEHLVAGPTGVYQGSQQHFAKWTKTDAQSIASGYGCTLDITTDPAPHTIQTANNILAPLLNTAEFTATTIEVGSALWAGTALPSTAADIAESSAGEHALNTGNALRDRLGHYQGAMFYFDGEWFWGVDRIRLLEARLQQEGYGSKAGHFCVPEPTPNLPPQLDATKLKLEYFPSLRSPYTAVGHRRILELIERTNISVDLRPVMPMLMRGVPAPQRKQQYIITDAAREARFRDVDFGNIVDPFGEPVMHAFAIFEQASKYGGGMPFVTAYLDAAWAKGIDITRTDGLKWVVARAGLDWSRLNDGLADNNWEGTLQSNLDAMLDAGLWGVPSFRISGGIRSTPFACWGQDRIWRVEQEIVSRL